MRRASFVPLCFALSACTGDQSPLAPAGEQADALSHLLTLMVWICGGMYIAVLAFLAASIWRARRSFIDADAQVSPADGHLTRSLWIWGGVVVVGLTTLAMGSFLTDRVLAAARDRQALEVRVTGHRWWWRIEYRDPASGRWIETANELHLPAGGTTRVTLASADVIHSFWVPNVAGKMDVIPGRRNVIDLTPRKIGWFRGQCAEFCGAQHAHMAFDVRVDDPASFRAWLRQQGTAAMPVTDPALARGFRIVTSGQCAMCHVVRGTLATGRAGPDLTHVGGRRELAAGTMAMSRGALQGWIASPQALKPGTLMPQVTLEPADLDAAARYLEGLK